MTLPRVPQGITDDSTSTAQPTRYPDLGCDARHHYRSHTLVRGGALLQQGAPAPGQQALLAPVANVSPRRDARGCCVSHANTLLGLVTVQCGGWVGKFSLVRNKETCHCLAGPRPSDFESQGAAASDT
jgi:hypothetical protein